MIHNRVKRKDKLTQSDSKNQKSSIQLFILKEEIGAHQIQGHCEDLLSCLNTLNVEGPF